MVSNPYTRHDTPDAELYLIGSPELISPGERLRENLKVWREYADILPQTVAGKISSRAPERLH